MNAVLELSAQTDGRWLRSVRTRAAIVDAWLGLIEEGDLSPTAKNVADRAGIGLRTVFQHFSDMNALHLCAGEEMESRIVPGLVVVPADLPLAERIEMVALNRGLVFEEISGVRRAFERQKWLSDDIHALVAGWEELGETSTRRVFAAELDAAPASERDTLAWAVDAVASWANWNQLRQRRGLSVIQCQTVISCTLQALLH